LTGEGRPYCVGVEQAQIGDEMLLVAGSNGAVSFIVHGQAP